MTDDIIRMAKEAGVEFTFDPTEPGDRVFAECWLDELERFAEFVRADVIAKERVDIAKHYEANLFVEHMGGSIADYVISRGNQ